MSCKLNPVIFDHSLERVIATQRRQSPLPCELLYITADDVVHPVFLKGTVLVPDHLELSIDLPQ
jgi:hypothetical protein